MPKVHVKLPNGHEYDVDDPTGSMSDQQAFQFVLAHDPDAQAGIAQDKAQDIANHPWRQALETAPAVLKSMGHTIVHAPMDIARSLTASMAPGYEPTESPAITALKEAIAHPSEIGPAFLQGAADPQTMGQAAGGLALTALTAKPTLGRVITKPVSIAAAIPEGVASSIPVQKALVGGTGAAALGAVGLPTAAAGIGADVALGALGAGAAETKLGNILPGVRPTTAAAEAVSLAQKDVVDAVRAADGNLNATTVKTAEAALKAANKAAGPTTGVGKMATGVAKLMRAPDRLLTGQSAFPAPPGAPPPPSVSPLPPAPGTPNPNWTSATVHPPEGPPISLPLAPGTPNPHWQSATNTPPNPAAEFDLLQQVLNTQKPSPPPAGMPPPPAMQVAPTPPPVAPAAPAAPAPYTGPVGGSVSDLNPTAVDSMHAAASPQFKALNEAGAFQGDRSTGQFAPPPGGLGTLPTQPPPAPPPNPIIAQNPPMAAADAAAASNRAKAGVLIDATPKPPISEDIAARLTDSAPPSHVDPNAATFDRAMSRGGRYGGPAEPQPLPKVGGNAASTEPASSHPNLDAMAQRASIQDKLNEIAGNIRNGLNKPNGPIEAGTAPSEPTPVDPKLLAIAKSLKESAANTPNIQSTGIPQPISRGIVPSNILSGSAPQEVTPPSNVLPGPGMRPPVAGPVTPKTIEAAKAAQQAERAAAGIPPEGSQTEQLAQRGGILDKLQEPPPEDGVASATPVPPVLPVAPAAAAPLSPLAQELGPTSINVHGPNPDLIGEIPDERGTSADIRQRILEDLKNPHMTMPEIRAKYGADRLGTELNPESPEASVGASLRTGPKAPSWMPDDVQAAVLRDMTAEPGTRTPAQMAKLTRAQGQLLDQYVRNKGPRPSDMGLRVFDEMKNQGLISEKLLKHIDMNR